MTDKRPLDDLELDGLFAAARREGPVPSGDLMARILADAEAEAVSRTKAAAVAAPPRQSRFAAVISALGGWPGFAGLATAAVAGLVIGIAAPETLEVVGGDYLSLALGLEIGDMMPALDALIGEG